MDDQEIIARLWDRFRTNADQHVAVLEAWHQGLATDADALQSAHKLAGSLGSYGRPDGSRAALALERRLRRTVEGQPVSDDDGDTGQLIRDLRAAVG